MIDREGDRWTLCSPDGSCPKVIKEALDTILGKSVFDPCPEDNPDAVLIIQP